MRKITLMLFTIIIMAMLFSCSNNESEELFLVRQTYTDKSGTTTTTYYYNDEYKIIKQVTDTGKDSSTVSEYGYDENDYQNYQKVTANSGLIQEIFLKNDSNGRVIERKIINNYKGNVTETVTTVEYIDENGSYKETSTSGVVTTWLLDEKGNYTDIISTGQSAQTVKYKNRYERGLLMEAEITTTRGTKTTKQTVKYEYDSLGNKIKSEVYDESGTVTVTETFEYSNKPEMVK